ncbi:heme ABC transporter ATP-binding protein [Thermus sediminis]|uniref:heme ABC transporter ATP-binding protein n=1 Tax=Thermus sediminis TaxID=1761908 RepID=UPI000E3E419A|nr:heme ABC transporter ATP-binding protein [Thermus sediminis]
MLEARALGHARNGRWLVEGVDLKLPAGSLVVLLGPNGAGKSTLLRLLGGEWAPSKGEVRLGEKSLRAYTPRELALMRAFLPQHRGVAFPYTAWEVVALGRLPHGRGPKEAERVAWALAQTGALHLAHRPYPSLSGGERARVDLARVLAQDTPVLLLDEPTNHLDPKQQLEVMALCRRLARGGRLVLSALHDLSLAALFADWLVFLKGGRLLAHGPPSELLRPELLQEVYEVPFEVLWHRGRPLAFPREG